MIEERQSPFDGKLYTDDTGKFTIGSSTGIGISWNRFTCPKHGETEPMVFVRDGETHRYCMACFEEMVKEHCHEFED